MLGSIIKAIKTRKERLFTYDSLPRKEQSTVVGVSTKGYEVFKLKIAIQFLVMCGMYVYLQKFEILKLQV
jgi:hypothetical protein